MSTTIDLDDQLKNVSLTEQFMLLSDYVATIDTTFDQEFQNCHDITCLDKIKPPPTLDKLVSMICNYTEKQYYKIFLVSSLCTQSTLKEAYNTLLPMLDDHPLAKNKLIKAYGLVDSKSKRDVFEEAYQVEHQIKCPCCFKSLLILNQNAKTFLKGETKAACIYCDSRFLFYQCDSCGSGYTMSKTIVKENYCAKCLKCSSILYTYIKFLKTNAEKEPFLKYITLYYEKRKELSTLQQIQQTYYTCGEDGENEKDLLSIQDQSILYRDGTLPQAEEQIIQERVKSRIHEAWDEFNAIGERKRRKAIENQSLSAAAATTTTTTTTTTQPVFLLKWYPEFHNGNSSRKSSNDKKRKRDRERKEKKKKKEKKKSISATKIDKKQQKEEREGEDLYRLLSPVEIEKEYIADGDDGFYKVENILDKKIEDGRIKYLIKWEGYNIMSASWQDIDDCFCPGLIAEFEIKYHERFSQ